MPPRKMNMTKQPSETKPSPTNQNKNTMGARQKSSSHIEEPKEEEGPPPIDIQAVIQECMLESNARIQEVLQNRQEQLMNKILQVDSAIAAGSKTRK